MARSLLAISAVFILSACASLPVGGGPAEPIPAVMSDPDGTMIEIEDFASEFVQPRRVSIWLPPGYSAAGDPYPVIYAHDGQNMFHVGHSGDRGKEWRLDETAAQMVADGQIRAPIIVGIWNTDRRWEEYAPQKVIQRLGADAPTEWTGPAMPTLEGDAYLRFIVEELKPKIDLDYNTAPDAANTFTLGSSMGGLISLYAAAEYPDVFSRIAAVSVHWPLAEPEGPIADQAIEVIQAYLETSRLDKDSQRLWMDNGTRTLDAYYPPYAAAMQLWFRNQGWREDQATFKTFEGTNHSETSWAARVDKILLFLLTP